MGNYENILLFDGVCNLCNSLVQFIIRHDSKGAIKFTPLQSEASAGLLRGKDIDPVDLNTVIFISERKLYFRSSAILHVFRKMGGAWPLIYALVIVPRFIRDSIYNRIAASRYRIFGKRESCMIPDENIRNRFI